MQTKIDFSPYAKQFKALADEKRLLLLHLLCKNGPCCVCDLTEEMEMPQSKLSYHLKVLLDAGLLEKEERGTWNYYSPNRATINHLLSEELCCILRPSC